MEILNEIIIKLGNWFVSPQGIFILQTIQIIAGILALLLIIILIYLIKITNYFKELFWQDFIEFITFKPYGKKGISRKIIKKWKLISNRLKSVSESDWKLAIIEAEAFLNEIFEEIGFEGENFGHKLKQIKTSEFSNAMIEDIWQAHKIRNNVVHDPNYKLSFEQAKTTLLIYEKVLNDLGFFDQAVKL